MMMFLYYKSFKVVCCMHSIFFSVACILLFFFFSQQLANTTEIISTDISLPLSYPFPSFLLAEIQALVGSPRLTVMKQCKIAEIERLKKKLLFNISFLSSKTSFQLTNSVININEQEVAKATAGIAKVLHRRRNQGKKSLNQKITESFLVMLQQFMMLTLSS